MKNIASEGFSDSSEGSKWSSEKDIKKAPSLEKAMKK